MSLIRFQSSLHESSSSRPIQAICSRISVGGGLRYIPSRCGTAGSLWKRRPNSGSWTAYAVDIWMDLHSVNECNSVVDAAVDDYSGTNRDLTRAGITKTQISLLAVFTARCCAAWTMLSQDVCPFVTRRYSVETAECIFKLFFTIGQPATYIILVFPHHHSRDTPRGGL